MLVALTDLVAPSDLFPIWLDAAVKGSLLLAVVAGGAALLGRAAASHRHLVWALGLTGMLALPMATLVVPDWGLRIETPAWVWQTAASGAPHLGARSAFGWRGQPQGTLHRADPPALPTADAQEPEELFSEPAPETVAEPTGEAATSTNAPVAAPRLQSAVARPGVPSGGWTWAGLALVLWMAGVGIGLTRYANSLAARSRLARAARSLDDPGWRRLSAEVAARYGIRRPVRLLHADRPVVPMTWGVARPVVLLPLEAGAWPEEWRRIVLLHELAHVRRWDSLTRTLGQWAALLYWFNPLVWVAGARLASECEQACDDLVLSSGARPSAYAACLLDLAGRLPAPGAAAAGVAMAGRTALEGRLLGILDPGRNRDAGSKGRGLLYGCLAVVLVLGLSAMQLRIAPTEPPPMPRTPTAPTAARMLPPEVEPDPAAGLVPPVPELPSFRPEIAPADGPAPLAVPAAAPDAVPVRQHAPSDSLTLDALIRLKVAGVDAAYVRAMRGALGRFDPDLLIALRHADADPAFVRAVRAIWPDVDGATLVALRHADADVSVIRALQGVWPDIEPREVIGLRHADADAAYVAALRTAISDLTPREAVRLAHAGVDVDFVRRLAEAGMTDLTVRQVIVLHEVGLVPSPDNPE